MRILQIPHRYPPSYGGVEFHVSLLSRWLVSNGHEVTVLTTQHPAAPKEYVDDGVKVIRAKVLGAPFRNPLSLDLVLRLRKIAEDFDVIHFHVPYAAHSVLGSYLAKRPKVVTLHGRPYYEGLGYYLLRVYEPLVMHSLRRADKIIVLTEEDLLFVKSHVEEDKIVLIPNFVDVEEIRRSVDGEGTLPPNGKVKLVYVGSLIERKGILQLVRIISKMPEVMLTIVGDGPLREKIREEMGENVRMLGRLERRVDVWREMHSSHALILPSRREGLPTVALEAMSLGRPVILSDIPPHRAAFGDAALYFDLERPHTLREAIEELKSSYESLSSRGRTLVESKYDVRVVAPQILSIYEEVVRARLDGDQD